MKERFLILIGLARSISDYGFYNLLTRIIAPIAIAVTLFIWVPVWILSGFDVVDFIARKTDDE